MNLGLGLKRLAVQKLLGLTAEDWTQVSDGYKSLRNGELVSSFLGNSFPDLDSLISHDFSSENGLLEKIPTQSSVVAKILSIPEGRSIAASQICGLINRMPVIQQQAVGKLLEGVERTGVFPVPEGGYDSPEHLIREGLLPKVLDILPVDEDEYDPQFTQCPSCQYVFAVPTDNE